MFRAHRPRAPTHQLHSSAEGSLLRPAEGRSFRSPIGSAHTSAIVPRRQRRSAHGTPARTEAESTRARYMDRCSKGFTDTTRLAGPWHPPSAPWLRAGVRDGELYLFQRQGGHKRASAYSLRPNGAARPLSIIAFHFWGMFVALRPFELLQRTDGCGPRSAYHQARNHSCRSPT